MTQSTASGTLQVEIQLDPRLLPGATDQTTATTTTLPTTSNLPSSSPSNLTSFTVPIPINVYSPVCELKRLISVRTGIPPYHQRLSLSGATDQFKLPSAVLLTKRPDRVEKLNVIIATYDETDPNARWTLTVDPSDTTLDLKFLIASTVKVAPEYQRLYVWRKGQRSREECLDHATVTESGIVAGSMLRILYEFPSTDSHHGTVHRSIPTLVGSDNDPTLTVAHIFRGSVAKYGSRKMTGTRAWNSDGTRGEYQWLSYRQMGDRVTNFSTGLVVGLGLKKGDAVGIIGVNRTEWVLADLACAVQSLVSVPLYDTFGGEAIQFIINHAAIKVVVAARANLAQINTVRPNCPSLQAVVLMDDQAPDKLYVVGGGKEGGQHGGFTTTVSQLEKLAQQKEPLPDNTPSGTTGKPKGAILQHRCLTSACRALDKRWPASLTTDDEILLSYLPLAHIYERQAEIGAISKGQGIGFGQGDVSKLVDDVAVLRPTLFPGVPRVWQRMYDRINAQVAESNFISRSLFEHAYASRLDQLAKGDHSASIWDSIVFSKIAGKFGGRLKLMVSGAAPLSPDVADFVKIAFTANLVEGYGLTETSAALTLAPVDGLTFGRAVGIPLECNEVKLVDVPDMSYLHTDKPYPRGEIWVRGANVFSGYYKQPDITSECFSDDGWFMTGDIGVWLNDGSLKIVDRKKNLFKLSQGEYIRPDHIESVYKQCKYISNIFVHGEPSANYLVALVVPNFEVLGNDKSVIKNPKVVQIMLASMDEAATRAKLNNYERVKQIALIEEEFTIENGLLTPTLKVKRHQVAKKYQQLLHSLYAEKRPETIKAKL